MKTLRQAWQRLARSLSSRRSHGSTSLSLRRSHDLPVHCHHADPMTCPARAMRWSGIRRGVSPTVLTAALSNRAQEAREGSRRRDLLRAAGDAITAMRTDMPRHSLSSVASPGSVAMRRCLMARTPSSRRLLGSHGVVKAVVRSVMSEHLFATPGETLEPYWRRVSTTRTPRTGATAVSSSRRHQPAGMG